MNQARETAKAFLESVGAYDPIMIYATVTPVTLNIYIDFKDEPGWFVNFDEVHEDVGTGDGCWAVLSHDNQILSYGYSGSNEIYDLVPVDEASLTAVEDLELEIDLENLNAVQ